MYVKTTDSIVPYWKRAFQVIFRVVLALLLFLFKITIAAITFFVRLSFALFDIKDDTDKKKDAHGGSTGEFRQATGFERDGPLKNGVPTKNDK